MVCCFLFNICVLNEDEIEEYSEEDDVLKCVLEGDVGIFL